MKKSNYFLKVKNWGKYGLLSMTLLFSGSVFADLSDGLIVHYIFDDAVVGGFVTDKSGSGNDGVLMGGAVVLPDQGFDGKGALYLGTVAKPAVDYLQLSDDITVGVNNFTVAAWIKLDNIADWQRIFDFGNGATNNMFLTVKGGTGMRFAIKKTNEQQIQGPALEINKWMHVAVSVDYTNSIAKLYLDGKMVGSSTGITHTPDGLGATNQNYIGAAQYPDAGYNGYVDDFRVYGRALSDKEMLELNGFPPAEIDAFIELSDAYTAFQGIENTILGRNDSFLDVWTDLDLMTKITGYDDVVLTWESSDSSMIATDGKRTLPVGAAAVELKVTFSHPVIPTLTKEKKYTLIVVGDDPLPAEIATFTFESPVYQDGKMKVISSANNPVKYAGTFENGVRVRTIGTAGNEYKVLDLGANNGYFDMGKEIGEVFTQLTDYTMSCYYLVEEDAVATTGAGNFLWTFSNSNNVGTDRNGYIFTQPWNSLYAITKTNYSAEQKVANNGHFSVEADYKAKWHNLLYSQQGNTGTIYVDGVSVATSSTISLWPVYLKLAGRKGTDFNYLGRSPYGGDPYFNKALLHDFRIYAYGLSSEDVDGLGIVEKLIDLDLAYLANDGRDQVNTELNAVHDALTMNAPAQITENLNFPASVEGHPAIAIAWTTSNEGVLDSKGKVMRQKYYDYPIDSISAKLIDTRTGEMLSKVFYTTSVVPMLEGTVMTTNDLLVHYDFSQVEDRIVTDKAELQLKGTLMNEANVITLATGEGEKTNVLDLGNGTGYFDMGTEIGQIMYHTTDYTLGAYVYIDEVYEDSTKAGNFLWTFANAEGANGGYIISILSNMRVEMLGKTKEGFTTYINNEGNNINKAAERGKWFHFAYSQEGDFGTIYLNGEIMNSAEIKNNPAAALPMAGKVGTPFNWIGRSNYPLDAYLRQTYVADFRFYGVALADLESELNLTATLEKLNNSSLITSITTNKADTPYRVFVKDGKLEMTGLQGGENISLFNILGRRYSVNIDNPVKLNSGIYIVKINNFTTKIWVK